ncbi:superoxide reductase [Methanococcoides vulcani]|uniref:Superoxide reductase n=1 Tax=Methanococcoides vulcani TaxID=1353158 RepID=A0A1I0BS22_9EURY|nr:class II SORL domain-containing protein [Methanococcoides vulcani]SET09163.1 superoxide reductase [Methanococcoides vulcani]
MTEQVINHLKDPENITETEMKHVPVIESEDVMTAEGLFEVTVRLGEVPHVMQDDHYIEWIELYLGDTKVGRVELSPSDEKAEATFTVEPTEEIVGIRAYEICHIRGVNVCGDCGTKAVIMKLKALASCNVHGLWQSVKQVEILSKKIGEGKACRWHAK